MKGLTLATFCFLVVAVSECKANNDVTKHKCAPFKPDSEKCNLILNLSDLQRDCGQVCNTTVKPVKAGKYYDVIRKDFDCLNLFESPTIDKRENETPAEIRKPVSFTDLPKRIKDLYSYQGRVQVRDMYMNDANAAASPPVWSIEKINSYRAAVRRGRPMSGYGTEAALDVERHLREHMEDVVADGHILVIGSQIPWVEAILLELGVRKITTVDYTPIINEHPQIETLTPEELSDQYLNQSGREYDGIVTYSSVEHSGLGRYGDDLNPWGDLIAMAKAYCLTRPGGKLLIGVPSGYDAVYFNMHRLYGPIQYSHLFTNWNVVYTEAKMFKDGIRTKEKDLPCTPGIFCYQPIHILEKESV